MITILAAEDATSLHEKLLVGAAVGMAVGLFARLVQRTREARNDA